MAKGTKGRKRGIRRTQTEIVNDKIAMLQAFIDELGAITEENPQGDELIAKRNAAQIEISGLRTELELIRLDTKRNNILYYEVIDAIISVLKANNQFRATRSEFHWNELLAARTETYIQLGRACHFCGYREICRQRKEPRDMLNTMASFEMIAALSTIISSIIKSQRRMSCTEIIEAASARVEYLRRREVNK